MTERWTVNYHQELAKEIRRLPKPVIKRLLEAIEALAENPIPPGSRKIEGHPLWRIKVGDYRILYQIDEEHFVVNTYRLGHRKDIYRRL